MNERITTARLALTAIALVMWGYGYRNDDERVRLAAICVLIVSMVLRFFRKKPADAPASE